MKSTQITTLENGLNLPIEFGNHSITIEGTIKTPLFKAKDIGHMLGISDIRTTIRTLKEHDRHTMPVIDSLGRVQETTFLTETGLQDII
jgi:prophage antirepressor-like protein